MLYGGNLENEKGEEWKQDEEVSSTRGEGKRNSSIVEMHENTKEAREDTEK
jgi:hypothetical protein